MTVMKQDDVCKVLNELMDRFTAERLNAIMESKDIRTKRLEWQITTLRIVQNRISHLETIEV